MDKCLSSTSAVESFPTLALLVCPVLFLAPKSAFMHWASNSVADRYFVVNLDDLGEYEFLVLSPKPSSSWRACVGRAESEERLSPPSPRKLPPYRLSVMLLRFQAVWSRISFMLEHLRTQQSSMHLPALTLWRSDYSLHHPTWLHTL